MLQITSSGRSLMYNRERGGSKMEPWGTPALTRYSCEDFPSRTTQSHLLFLQVINISIINKFFKYLTNQRKKTNRAIVFSCRTFSNILQYRNHRWELSTVWKTRLLQTQHRHILKCLTSMYESSSSQFFRTTTGIQSGLGGFDELRFIMTF